MNITLDKSIKFSGYYRGIRFLISHHGVNEDYNPLGTWCYYLYVNEKQLPEDYKKDFILEPVFDEKGRVSHAYYNSRIADLDWHGGITFYNKESGADGEPVIVKIGCDYAHLQDKMQRYDENYILHDVKNTINRVYELFPDIKIFSFFYGGFFKESEGEYGDSGRFVAFKELDKLEIDRRSKK